MEGLASVKASVVVEEELACSSVWTEELELGVETCESSEAKVLCLRVLADLLTGPRVPQVRMNTKHM